MASSESRPLLLDVNALLALAWPNHHVPPDGAEPARAPARPRVGHVRPHATRFVRLSSNPAIVGVRQTPAQALDVLARLVRDRRHRYVERLPPPGQVDKYFRRLLGTGR